MKTTPKRSSTPVWLLLVLALGVSAVATSMSPSDAVARTRPENSEPLAGDPDVTDAPSPGHTKSAAVARTTVGSQANGEYRTRPMVIRILWNLWSSRMGLFPRA